MDLFREYDPDIVVGWETETMGIGYLCKRAEKVGIGMANMLSRVPLTMKKINESYYN